MGCRSTCWVEDYNYGDMSGDFDAESQGYRTNQLCHSRPVVFPCDASPVGVFVRSFRRAACFMCHEMLKKLIDTRPSFSLSTHPQLSQYVWNLK